MTLKKFNKKLHKIVCKWYNIFEFFMSSGDVEMIFKDYYKILDLPNNKVSMTQIKTAYREQAKKYHPDVNIANSRNEERFKDINEAYRVLSDNISKRKYDRLWNRTVGRKNASYEESKRKKGSLSSDFFNMFFGNPIQEDKQVKRKNKKGTSKRRKCRNRN